VLVRKYPLDGVAGAIVNQDPFAGVETELCAKNFSPAPEGELLTVNDPLAVDPEVSAMTLLVLEFETVICRLPLLTVAANVSAALALSLADVGVRVTVAL
jgi:hypothetical protein